MPVHTNGQSLYDRYWADILAEDRWRAERKDVFALVMRFRKVPDAREQ